MSSQSASAASTEAPSTSTTAWGAIPFVDVDTRLIETPSLQRRIGFQSLVRQYARQILFGCINESCTTPTCRSCKERLTTSPFRPPKERTARALACFLATQDDPRAALCPHELKAGPLMHTQAAKDVKSLSQNLHDTQAAIGLFRDKWETPLETPKALLAQGPRLRSTTSPSQGPVAAERGGSEPASSKQRIHWDARDIVNDDAVQSPERVDTTTALRAASGSLLNGNPALVENNSVAGKRAPSVGSGLGAQHHSPVPLAVTNGEGSGREKDELTTLRVASHLSSDIIAALYLHGDSSLQSSLVYCLSDPSVLLRSFREVERNQLTSSPLPHLDSNRVVESFRLIRKHKRLIVDSLWQALPALFARPPVLDSQRSPIPRPAQTSSSLASVTSHAVALQKRTINSYLSDLDAAHIVVICIYALTSLPSSPDPDAWAKVREWRPKGHILPPGSSVAAAVLNLVDAYEYEPAIRLAERLVRGIAARRCFSEILHTSSYSGNHTDASSTPAFSLIDMVLQHLSVVESASVASAEEDGTIPGWTISRSFLDWLQTVVLKRWERNPVVNRWSGAGAAFEIMEDLYQRRSALGVPADMFAMPYLADHMDYLEMPADFMMRPRNPNTRHLFEFNFLFSIGTLVGYFRTVNHAAMYKQFEVAETAVHLKKKLETALYEGQLITGRNPRLDEETSKYLVLEVKREHALEDTLNALWGLQRHQFLKPLKIKFESEPGQDQGGVSAEFFGVILQGAFNRDKGPLSGMFTRMPDTTHTWFQPGSLEPAWKFEMMGAVFSLAVFNGIPLSVHFPLAFYAALMGIPVTELDMIRDAWGPQADNFEKLLKFDKGDVADWDLTYSFYYRDVVDGPVGVDMTAFGRDDLWPADYEGQIKQSGATIHQGMWPDRVPLPPIGHAAWSRPLPEGTSGLEQIDVELNNQNREKYVQDYLFWLTDKSIRPQLRAFKKGFYTCLNPKAVSIFGRPETLQSVVEGSTDFSIANLKALTEYGDHYSESDPNIRNFWSIVSQYSNERRKALVEFITGRDRLPVGADNAFTIVNQGSLEHLPSSSTCTLRFNLPRYETKEMLARKLALALDQPREFQLL